MLGNTVKSVQVIFFMSTFTAAQEEKLHSRYRQGAPARSYKEDVNALNRKSGHENIRDIPKAQEITTYLTVTLVDKS